MEIKKATDKLEQADGFLTKLKTILKKHWGILLFLGFIGGVYWMFTTDFEETVEEPAKTEETTPKFTIIKKEFIIDKEGYRKGDTIYVDYYSDGYIEKYYTDGESFND